MNSEVEALMATFLEEARDNLAVLERGLLRLETEPQHIDSIHEIFRAAHSVKGGAGLVGLKEIAEFTHRLETVLDSMRQGHLPVDSAVVSALLNATDELRRLIDGVSNHVPIEGDERVFNALLVLMEKPVATPIYEELVLFDSPSLRTVELRLFPKVSLFTAGLDPKLLFVDLESLGTIMSVMCDMSRIPALSRLAPTDCYISWSIRILTEATDSAIFDVFSFVAEDCSVEIVGSKAREPEVKVASNREINAVQAVTQHESATLRVNSEKVDSIIDLVGELVIAQSMVMQLLGPSVVSKNPMLRDAAESMRRNMQELQERVMGIRMVPIATLFGRFARIVRDTATALKKTVCLEFEGQETEIDKAVVERLVDPLTHLVRNALDHGIETDEERLALGKLDRATIRLRGKHVAGGVVIEVEDNGRGLNTARILEKAKKQGLITGNEQLTDDQIHALIFAPGFSTADVVSDLSGRGVGMDVVRRSVDALNGSTSISTVPGEGTILRIRIPLTLAILDGLTLRVGNQPYIVPLLTVVESFRPKSTSIKQVTGVGTVAMVRDVALPLVDLGVELGITNAPCDPCSALVVVVESDGRQIGLIVDAMIGQSQVVVKSMETHYRRVEGVLGATILGDGTVAFIIDVAGVTRLTLTKKQQNGTSYAA